MKHADASDPSPDDSRLDDLLRDFFASEMPAEIRRLKDTPPATVSRKAVAARSGVRPAFFQLSVIALCLLLFGFVLWFSTARHNEPVTPMVGTLDGASIPLSDDIPNPAQPAGRPPGFSLSQNVEPIESLTYDTVNGPVQQRTNVSTTSVSFIEPGTGDLLEMVLPELTIEIFPIEDDPAKIQESDPTKPKLSPKGIGAPVLLPEQQSGSSP